MKINEKYCDHCGVALDSMIDYDGLTVVINHVTIETDLCCDCFSELCKIVKKFVKKGDRKR